MYEELVETGQIAEIKTTKILQDDIESFFGRLRSGNNNNNPTVEQFCAKFSQTVVNKELTSSTLSNCIDNLDILAVSCKQSANNLVPRSYIMYANTDETLDEDDMNNWDDLGDLEGAFNDELVLSHDNNPKNMAEKLGVANVAGLIESRIQMNYKFDCDDCANIFEINEKVDQSIFVKNKKNVIPCASTYDICNICNHVMKVYCRSVHESAFIYGDVFNEIKSKLNLDDFYPLTTFEHDSGHKIFILKFVIEEFVRIFATTRAKELTLNEQKRFLRQKKTREVNFAGL